MIKHPKEITVKVTKAFFLAGEPVPVGTVISMEYIFAAELIHSGKAIKVDPVPAIPAKPIEPEEIKPAKGKKNERI